VDADKTTGLSRGERLVLLIVGIALVVVTVVVIGRVGEPNGGQIRPASDRPTPGPDIDLPISVEDALSFANVWAREWNADAELILVSSQFEMSGESPSATPVADGGLIVFSFAAPKVGDSWPRASVAISRQTGSIFFDETTAFEVEPPDPITERFLTLPISAEQAFRIAEGVVGASYREGCEESRRQVQVDLDTTDPEDTWWVVVYYDMRNQGTNDIVVRVNAETGEPSSETRSETTCDVAPGSPVVIADQAAVERVHFLV